jgi:C1A family cysteine protease
MPSRLFLYFNERYIENSIYTDSGASLRDGMKVLNEIGVCSEEKYPYEIQNFALKPSIECYKSAYQNRSVKYRRINVNAREFIYALNYGFPVIFGFSVYESFEND